MTNKLGSSNPNRIPKKRDIELEMKEYFAENTFSEDRKCLDRIIDLQKRIDAIKNKDISHFNTEQLEELCNLDEEINDKRIEFDKYMSNVLIESENKIDVFGTPMVKSYEYEKAFANLDLEKLKDEVFSEICNDKSIAKMLHEFTDDDINIEIDYILEILPKVLEGLNIKFGEEYQSMIKPLITEMSNSIRRLPSKKKGKIYISKSEQEIIQKLEIYWDDNLPLGDNRKSYFNKIADDYGKSFDAIKKIEKRNRPSTFKPSRK